MSAFRLISGGARPGGPRAVGIPQFGGQIGRKDSTAAGRSRSPRSNNRSKKAHTGTVAGIGRTPLGTVRRSGPGGPRAFGGSTQLPRRGEAARAAVANRPSLMTRIGGRLKRTAAAFGF